MYEHSNNNIELTVCLSMCRRAAGPIGLSTEKIFQRMQPLPFGCLTLQSGIPPQARNTGQFLTIRDTLSPSRTTHARLTPAMLRQSVSRKSTTQDPDNVQMYCML
jgi:hypothetical protein